MVGSIALSDDNHLLAEYQVEIRSTYSDMLLTFIDHLLSNANIAIHEIDGFALAIGPGSFTALRIGLSIIKGLAHSTGKPIVGIPTLDGLASNICFSDMLVCPVLDAKKGEVYTALYKANAHYILEKLTPDRAVTPESLLSDIQEKVIFLGEGSDLYRDTITHRLKEKAFFAPLQLRYPKASSVTQIALEKFKNNEVEDIEKLVPLYVRPPETDLKSEKTT